MTAHDDEGDAGSLRARFRELLRSARGEGAPVIVRERHDELAGGDAMQAAKNGTDTSREVTSRVLLAARDEGSAPHRRAALVRPGAGGASTDGGLGAPRSQRRPAPTSSGEHACVERRSTELGGRIATADLDGLCVRAALHARGGRVDYGLRLALACIAEEPLDPRGYLVAADIQEQRGRLDEAEQLLERVALISPNTPLVRSRLIALRTARRACDACRSE